MNAASEVNEANTANEASDAHEANDAHKANEVNKANDKTCNRRRGDALFNPTKAIEHVQRLKKGVNCRSKEYMQAVKKQFKEVKMGS